MIAVAQVQMPTVLNTVEKRIILGATMGMNIQNHAAERDAERRRIVAEINNKKFRRKNEQADIDSINFKREQWEKDNACLLWDDVEGDIL